MASASLIPKNGSINFNSSAFLADFAAFDIEAGQAVDNVTPYGNNTCSKNVGSGTPDFTFNVGAFALAHATATAPLLPSMSATGYPTSVFTLDTGVTYTCTAIVARFRISHARMRGFVPFAITLRNGGDVTEAWIVT